MIHEPYFWRCPAILLTINKNSEIPAHYCTFLIAVFSKRTILFTILLFPLANGKEKKNRVSFSFFPFLSS